MEAAIDADWHRLGSPGTWWTGEQRVAIAGVARHARAGESPAPAALADVAVKAAATITTEAHRIDADFITHCQAGGVSPLQMVELLAIVARVSAIDTFMEGVGEPLLPLPEPRDGKPAQAEVPGAKLNHGWLPTVGRAGAPVCFSAVADEHRAWQQLHGVFYLSMDEMRDLDLVKDLYRSQIELLAARTSHYNDCFY